MVSYHSGVLVYTMECFQDGKFIPSSSCNVSAIHGIKPTVGIYLKVTIQDHRSTGLMWLDVGIDL